MNGHVIRLMGLAVVLLAVGCTNKDETETIFRPVEILAPDSAYVLDETREKLDIDILFSAPVPASGKLRIRLKNPSVYGSRYRCIPEAQDGLIELGFAEGQTKITLTVMALDNSEDDGGVSIPMVLEDAGVDLRIPSQNQISIRIRDNETAQDVTFVSETYQVIPGESESQVISLRIPEPAAGNGQLRIRLQGAEYGTSYTSVPAAIQGVLELPVQAGDTLLTFRIYPAESLDRPLIAEASLESLGGGLQAGAISTARIGIIPRSRIAEVSFATLQTRVTEAGPAVSIPIRFSQPAASDGYVDLSYYSSSAVYNRHYQLNPSPAQGFIRIPFRAGDTLVLLECIPLNDDVVNTTRNLDFFIQHATGGVIPTDPQVHTISIMNNDAAASHSIRDIRSLFNGQQVTLGNDVEVEAVITTQPDNFPYGLFYIQDISGGIAIRLNAPTGYAPGTVIRVDLSGATLREERDFLLLEGLAASRIRYVGVENTTVPVYTLVELKNLPISQEGRRVKIQNLRFDEADSGISMQGDRPVSDGIHKARIRTESGAYFSHYSVPGGIRSVTGICILTAEGYIIQPSTWEDIE